MDAARWRRLESVLGKALECSPEERAALLDEACLDDVELRGEVESLLDQLEEDPSFLETPVARVSELGEEWPREDDREPRHIGPYRLIRLLGQGGMGEVYLAMHEGEGFERSVAVKVIRRGMDTDQVLKRFHMERRILASLQDPNIAFLLDGGATDDGRPYFVMEYVEGAPVDEYCDREGLTVRQRLELFESVCSGVQHAHQNLVVHRDLKPSNILVTSDGNPKLLDFGIGKLLDPERWGPGVATRTEVRVLTPEYASPEQVQGEAVTAASDVYCLGVLLYELLTGHHPYAAGKRSLAEMERAVCDEIPERPSNVVGLLETQPRWTGSTETITPEEVSMRRATEPRRLRRALSGDLDNIVAKALRKEPSRRYASAAALAEDIRRHLDRRPVRARPDTVSYRTAKFLRRNRIAVSAGAIVFLVLASSLGYTAAQSRRVAAERDKALEVRGFLLEMFGASRADQATGDVVTARQLLDGQLTTLNEAYGNEPELRAEMMSVLAEGYDRLGLYDDAEPLARQALEARRAILAPGHPDVAASLNTLGWILHEKGQSADGEVLLRESLALWRGARSDDQSGLARALNDLGVVRDGLGDQADAEPLFRESLEIRRSELGEEHRSFAVTASNLAGNLYRQGDFAAAVEMGSQALASLRRSLGDDHVRSIIAQTNLATFRLSFGDTDAAIAEFRDVIERRSRLDGRRHSSTAQAMTSLSVALIGKGENAEAQPLLREALSIQEETLGSSHRQLASTLTMLANSLTATGSIEEAITLYDRSLEILRASFEGPHWQVGRAIAGLASLYARMDEVVEAERLHREAVEEFTQSLGVEHPETAAAMVFLGRALLSSGKPEEALAVFAGAHEVTLDLLPAAHGLTHRTRMYLAQAHVVLGEFDTADSLLAVTEAGLAAGEGRFSSRDLFEYLTGFVEERRPTTP